MLCCFVGGLSEKSYGIDSFKGLLEALLARCEGGYGAVASTNTQKKCRREKDRRRLSYGQEVKMGAKAEDGEGVETPQETLLSLYRVHRAP